MSEPEERDAVLAVLAVADELYAAPPADFTPRRTELAKEVAGAHGKPAGQQVTRLKKPSTAAWAVNLLVRRDADQIDQVLALAEQLRAAAEALDGEELRALTRQRRQLTTALATTARRRAAEAGTRLSEAVVDQVQEVLTAALLDPVAARVVRTGRVLTAFEATGVSEVDPEAVVALPDELDHQAPVSPADQDADQEPEQPSARPELTLVVDDEARRREEQEQAQEALEQAEEQEEQLRSDRDAARSVVRDLDAKRLQLRGEADELRRRLAELEEQAEEVDDDHEAADAELEEAEAALAEAVEELAQARAEVDRLA